VNSRSWFKIHRRSRYRHCSHRSGAEEGVQMGMSLQQGHAGPQGRSCQFALLSEVRGDTADRRESWSSTLPGSELLRGLLNGTWVNSIATTFKRSIRSRLQSKRRGLTCSSPATREEQVGLQNILWSGKEQGSGGVMRTTNHQPSLIQPHSLQLQTFRVTPSEIITRHLK
jgi:hypothetical protein